MPNLEFRDGNQVFVEMFLKNGNDSEEAVNLNVMANHIQDFTFEEKKGKVSNVHFKLYDQTFDSFENVLFSGGLLEPSNARKKDKLPLIGIRWGWVNGEKRIQSPVWDMRVTKYTSRFQFGQGVEIEISGVAAPGAIFKRGTDSIEKGKTKLSDLVKRIADRNGLSFNANAIEDGTATLNVSQKHQNDFKWLKDVAKYAFKSDSGGKKYEVWIRNRGDGTEELVVKTDKANQGDTTWDFLYGLDRDGQVLEYETEINSSGLFALGAGGYKAVIFDHRKKECKEIVANSRTLPGVAGEGRFIPVDSNTPAPLRLAFPAGEDGEQAAKDYAAAKYLALNATNIKSRLVIVGNPVITPSDMANVVVLRGSQGIRDIRDLHPTSGAYNIFSATHNISNGDYTTELILYRRGNLAKGAGGNMRTNGTQTAGNQVSRAQQTLGGDQFKKEVRRRQAKRYIKDPVALQAELDRINGKRPGTAQ